MPAAKNIRSDSFKRSDLAEIDAYAEILSETMDRAKEEYAFSDLDAVLVLKNISYHLYLKKKGKGSR